MDCQNRSCYSQIHYECMIPVLLLLLNILYITPGINHSINVNFKCHYYCSYNEGNQELIGQHVLHNLYA